VVLFLDRVDVHVRGHSDCSKVEIADGCYRVWPKEVCGLNCKDENFSVARAEQMMQMMQEAAIVSKYHKAIGFFSEVPHLVFFNGTSRVLLASYVFTRYRNELVMTIVKHSIIKDARKRVATGNYGNKTRNS
jgi:hypothetical protein